MKPLLVVVCGPTASGKTELAVRLAEAWECEVVSADSRQIYRELPIGSAAPSDAELLRVKHHLIGSVSIHEHYNAGRFESDAQNILIQLFQQNPIQILVGGTGLYIKALAEGLDDLPQVPVEIREYYSQKLESKGISELQNELKQRDSVYALEVDLANKARLIRALELIETTGIPYSLLRKGAIKKLPFDVCYVMPEWNREVLYRRINERAEKMLANGWIEEARNLLEHRNLKALQTLGYPEIFEMLDGTIDRTECLKKIQQATRRYAKRQLTWFRNQTQCILTKAIISDLELKTLINTIATHRL
ncbi:MAG: tRNA (adenosine(37)-N6)-dimethylallyltransferase MiaA [Bacteroidia bacterium]|jgi:tRNA dimethylallyltransferase